MRDFWATCLNWFEQELPTQQFNTWIKGLRLEVSGAESKKFHLIAPNRFILQWVRERYLAQIEALGNEFFSYPISVELSVEDVIPSITEQTKPEIGEKAVPPSQEFGKKDKFIENNYSKTHLNQDFTFETL
ncbi:MAG: DnaA N-terminal domain-containing protein, partial [Rugosibacter sp.]|nr:DnaA N-terminal domain-containing protein [Rugosibacter sp.]